jgi:hypothetical protein
MPAIIPACIDHIFAYDKDIDLTYSINDAFLPRSTYRLPQIQAVNDCGSARFHEFSSCLPIDSRNKGWTGCADIRAREEADPHCRAYPRFKRHDDATAVALTLKED